MKSKELKSEKIKKRKKKRAKADGSAVAVARRTEGGWTAEGKEEELKEEKEEECKAQVLNGDRESEREREKVTCWNIFSVLQLQDCCNCVAVCGRDKVSDFSIFFAVYK